MKFLKIFIDAYVKFGTQCVSFSENKWVTCALFSIHVSIYFLRFSYTPFKFFWNLWRFVSYLCLIFKFVYYEV